jgi:outer membrane protein OmpA-like peptidoglycan-associated protein
MKLRNALLIATFLTAPVVAMAQPVTGLYVAGAAGYSYLMETNASIRQSTGTNTNYITSDGKIKTNGGGVAIGSLGWGFGNGLRVEVEGNGTQQSTRFSAVVGSNSTTGALGGGGSLTSYGVSVNALYDFYLGSPFVPFVGAGVGYNQTMLSSYKIYNGGSSVLYQPNNSAKGGVTGTGILGVAYNIASVPGLALTGMYRFSGLFQSTTFSGPVTLNGNKVTNGTLRVEDQYNHQFLVGVRYAFNAPRPAPAPAPAPVVAPAPAPARSYLVFFDWDKDNLSARAQQIIAEAAQASTRVAATQIGVAGHADRTGSAAYNQALSLRRANNVAAELVRLGVSKSAIVITAFGDTKPLVPTGPNTREPQNRRVEIVLK